MFNFYDCLISSVSFIIIHQLDEGCFFGCCSSNAKLFIDPILCQYHYCPVVDSTVLAYVLNLLNERHGYGVHLELLSIDEGITGYRDDSLEVIIGCSLMTFFSLTFYHSWY
jgi:hypothetical protein